MKITTVIENVSNIEGIQGVFGLSLFIEANGEKILVDCGKDAAAYENFSTLGFRPSDIEKIFISHNHYDHFGGFPQFAAVTEKVPVYISLDADRELWSKRLFKKYIVSKSEYLSEYKDRFVLIEDMKEIGNGVFACRVKSPEARFFCRDKKLKKRENDGHLTPDTFEHEMYLAVIEDNECKIISSCSHNGAVNIINDAKKRFKDTPVTTFVGGLHMRGRKATTLNCKPSYIKEVIGILNSYNIKKLYTSHCTGYKAYGIIKKYFKQELHYFSSGVVFEV